MTRRVEKQLAQLDSLEAEFCAALIEPLKRCAAGRSSRLFLASSLRPDHWPPVLRSEVADGLLTDADLILKIRAQHGLPVDDCLAARYRAACERHVDLDDAHRPGTRREAQQLLAEIEDSRSSG